MFLLRLEVVLFDVDLEFLVLFDICVDLGVFVGVVSLGRGEIISVVIFIWFMFEIKDK